VAVVCSVVTTAAKSVRAAHAAACSVAYIAAVVAVASCSAITAAGAMAAVVMSVAQMPIATLAITWPSSRRPVAQSPWFSSRIAAHSRPIAAHRAGISPADITTVAIRVAEWLPAAAALAVTAGKSMVKAVIAPVMAANRHTAGNRSMVLSNLAASPKAANRRAAKVSMTISYRIVR